MNSTQHLKSWCEDTYDDFPTTGLKPKTIPKKMKKNEGINSKQRGKSVQFWNNNTKQLELHTFYGTETEISSQIDEFLAKNLHCTYKQQFSGIIGGIIGAIAIGIILLCLKVLL